MTHVTGMALWLIYAFAWCLVFVALMWFWDKWNGRP